MEKQQYFVTAIGTDCGKTVISAIVARAIGGTYWKPVQSGEPTDTARIRAMTENKVPTLKETHVLALPASPHYAAASENKTLKLSDFSLPKQNKLVVEGAGGMLVPLNEKEFVIDMATKWKIPVILVCNIYLGSINHSLLSIEFLKQRNINVAGIIFNGQPVPSTEEIIEHHCPWPVLLRVRHMDEITLSEIDKYAEQLSLSLSAFTSA